MSDKEVLVKVEGLSKKFCKDLRTGLWYGVQDLFTNFMGNKNDRTLRDKEFWALQDINFELKRGECLGLIGHNGAGKSTLLKILNGLIKPDAGKVTIKGRVGALIELGAGFNPILTGRENIYNNGAILGFTREEIDNKLDEIIDFAEIREFIDMPVQHYSSGMKVRLGFAVAAQMEPDVLLIDEVLAVGDLGFTLKCLKTIDTILPNTALIFVSHNMPMVSRICNQILLLDNSRIFFKGIDVSKGIDRYYRRFSEEKSNLVFSDASFELINAEIFSKNKEKGIAQLNWNDKLEIFITISVRKKYSSNPFINIIISDQEQRPVAVMEPHTEGCKLNEIGVFSFVILVQNIQLSKGIYNLSLVILNNQRKGPHYRLNNFLKFQIYHKTDFWQPFLLKSQIKNINSRPQ